MLVHAFFPIRFPKLETLQNLLTTGLFRVTSQTVVVRQYDL